MSDLAGRLRCCAGISPGGQTTRLRPEARKMMEEAADAIEALEARVKDLEMRGDVIALRLRHIVGVEPIVRDWDEIRALKENPNE